jgi:hypothetical protein
MRILAVLGIVFVLFGGLTPTEVSAQTAFDADIEAACATYGCDAEGLKRVAMCESAGTGLHTWPDGTYVTGPNGEIGLFQFHPAGTWGAVGNVYTQIDIAAQQFAAGLGGNDWSCAWAYY